MSGAWAVTPELRLARQLLARFASPAIYRTTHRYSTQATLSFTANALFLTLIVFALGTKGTNMRTNYPTEKRYSLQRHLTDVLDHGSAELYEADESLRIRDQLKAMGKASPDGAAEVRATSDPRSIRPSIRGEQTRTTFLPYSAFGKIQTRSDLGVEAFSPTSVASQTAIVRA